MDAKLGPHTPHDLFLALDEALELAPTQWRAVLEVWHSGLHPNDRSVIDAQRADFVQSRASPLLRAAALAWAGPDKADHLAAFLLGLGSARAHLVLRDPDLLADLDPSAVTPWEWLPPTPIVRPASPEELARRCPRLAGVDSLAPWPEVAALPESAVFRQALRGAPDAWSRVQEVCAPFGEASPAGVIAMPFLLAHRDGGIDDFALVQIGAASLQFEPHAPWRDDLEGIALDALAHGPADEFVIGDLARILGEWALFAAMGQIRLEERLVECPACGEERRLETAAPAGPVATALAAAGHTHEAGAIAWVRTARCSGCDAPYLGGT